MNFHPKLVLFVKEHFLGEKSGREIGIMLNIVPRIVQSYLRNFSIS